MSTEVVWKLYLATRLHYLHGFDAKKYKGRFNHMEKTLQRPDKALVRGTMCDMTTKRQVVEYCCSNFLQENDNFLYGNQDDADQYHAAWCSFWRNPTYFLTADLSCIEAHVWKAGKTLGDVIADGSLYPLLLENKLRRESLCVLVTWFPGLNLVGFGSEKTLERIKKTIAFKDNSIAKIDRKILEQFELEHE